MVEKDGRDELALSVEPSTIVIAPSVPQDPHPLRPLSVTLNDRFGTSHYVVFADGSHTTRYL